MKKYIRLVLFLIVANTTIAIGQEVIYDEYSRISKQVIWDGETNTPSDKWSDWSDLIKGNDRWTFFFHKKTIHWSTRAIFIKQYEWSKMTETYKESGLEGKRVLKFECFALDSYTAKTGYNHNFWLVYHDDNNIQLYIFSKYYVNISNISQKKD